MQLARTILILPFLAGIPLLYPAVALADCTTKERILEKKLAIAKSKGNSRQAAGLEHALANIRLYCNDASLRGKAEMKVLEKQEEVMEREADLEEARTKGDSKKIAKREKKLREARDEMMEAENALKEFVR